MKITFTVEEARVIGALLEKEITTPDQYPLSLNALVNAAIRNRTGIRLWSWMSRRYRAYWMI
jgi:uncharacterized protein YceH (UPF0502 family)